jgi:hypothetical protein
MYRPNLGDLASDPARVCLTQDEFTRLAFERSDSNRGATFGLVSMLVVMAGSIVWLATRPSERT